MKHWVKLNDEGKELYGDIFVDGVIPVKSFIPEQASLGEEGKIQRIYIIPVDQLTDDQFARILEKLSKKFNAHKSFIERDFRAGGIPLREELTSGSGTRQLVLFI